MEGSSALGLREPGSLALKDLGPLTKAMLSKACDRSSSEYVAELPNEGISSLSGTAIESFPKLRLLDLSFNLLVGITGLEALSDLRELKVNNNKVTGLAGLERCKKLEKLSLQNNDITRISGLQDAKFLRILRLDGNKLVAVDGLDKCFSLQELDASRNSITSTKGLKAASKLCTLNLAYNRLTALGPELCSLSSTLSELNVSWNHLSILTGCASLAALRSLDISHNQLKSWEGLGPLPQLCELYVSHNELGPSLPASFGTHFPRLEILDVSNNKLTATPLASALLTLAQCTSLSELDVRGNPAATGLSAHDVLSSISTITTLEIVNGETVGSAGAGAEAVQDEEVVDVKGLHGSKTSDPTRGRPGTASGPRKPGPQNFDSSDGLNDIGSPGTAPARATGGRPGPPLLWPLTASGGRPGTASGRPKPGQVSLPTLGRPLTAAAQALFQDPMLQSSAPTMATLDAAVEMAKFMAARAELASATASARESIARMKACVHDRVALATGEMALDAPMQVAAGAARAFGAGTAPAVTGKSQNRYLAAADARRAATEALHTAMALAEASASASAWSEAGEDRTSGGIGCAVASARENDRRKGNNGPVRRSAAGLVVSGPPRANTTTSNQSSPDRPSDVENGEGKGNGIGVPLLRKHGVASLGTQVPSTVSGLGSGAFRINLNKVRFDPLRTGVPAGDVGLVPQAEARAAVIIGGRGKGVGASLTQGGRNRPLSASGLRLGETLAGMGIGGGGDCPRPVTPQQSTSALTDQQLSTILGAIR